MDPTYGGVQCTHNVNNRIDRHLLVARETLAPDLATGGYNPIEKLRIWQVICEVFKEGCWNPTCGHRVRIKWFRRLRRDRKSTCNNTILLIMVAFWPIVL